MSKKKYTVGIDFGTLSVRAAVVDVSDGRELASAAVDYEHGVIDSFLPGTSEPLPPGTALQDPSDYTKALEILIPRVIASAGIDKNDIAGAGVDFTACTLIPIYADGTPLCLTDRFRKEKNAWCKLWKHHAAQPYADRINELYAKSGGHWLDSFGKVISSEFFIPKVWQTLDEAPEVYNAADCFIEACDWIVMLLTGELTRSYVLASYKAEYSDEDGYPPDSFLRMCDPRLEGLFATKGGGGRIVRTGEVAGRVTAAAAARFGLPEGCAVAGGLPDAHVGGFPLGITEPGDMFGIFGTSSCYFLLGEERREVPGICGCVKDGILPGYYGFEAGLCCFGDHFAWAAERICPPEYAAEAERRGISKLRLLIEKASKLKPGECGLLALDWWNGNRSILVDNELRGLLVGMTLGTRAEDIMRALIEATAFATRVITENFISHGVPVKRIVAAGGVPRKDPFTMQLFSDVLGLPIEVAATSQAPALGDAINAAVACGAYGSLPEASAAMKVGTEAVYLPDAGRKKTYDRLYAEYVKLHDWFGRGGSDVMYVLGEIEESV